MSLLDYYSKILSKIRHKRYEYYVISRFLHRLDDFEIEIHPQQYIARKDGFALADLYLPQFNIVLEVDESYHHNIQVKEADSIREQDIISAIDAKIFRVPIFEEDGKTQKSIDEINQLIDDFIDIIHAKKQALSQGNLGFEPWDINRKLDPGFYIDKGDISLQDGCVFKRIVDALRCFGLHYKGYQRGGAYHPHEENTVIWFPKLYPNDGWENSLNSTEDLIIEKATKADENDFRREAHVVQTLSQDIEYRVVFAHGKNLLGETLYRFKGRFKLDREASNVKDGLIWRRDCCIVKTYSNL